MVCDCILILWILFLLCLIELIGALNSPAIQYHGALLRETAVLRMHSYKQKVKRTS